MNKQVTSQTPYISSYTHTTHTMAAHMQSAMNPAAFPHGVSSYSSTASNMASPSALPKSAEALFYTKNILVTEQSQPSHATSLFTKAKAITNHILKGVALPENLKKYQNVFAILAGISALGYGTCYLSKLFFENRSQKKVQRAVFHLLHKYEQLPDLEERLENPFRLVEEFDREIQSLVNKHELTKAEAFDTSKEIKRRISDDVHRGEYAKILKRQRQMDNDEAPVVGEQQQATSEAAHDSAPAEEEEQRHGEDINMQDVDDESTKQENLSSGQAGATDGLHPGSPRGGPSSSLPKAGRGPLGSAMKGRGANVTPGQNVKHVSFASPDGSRRIAEDSSPLSEPPSTPTPSEATKQPAAERTSAARPASPKQQRPKTRASTRASHRPARVSQSPPPAPSSAHSMRTRSANRGPQQTPLREPSSTSHGSKTGGRRKKGRQY